MSMEQEESPADILQAISTTLEEGTISSRLKAMYILSDLMGAPIWAKDGPKIRDHLENISAYLMIHRYDSEPVGHICQTLYDRIDSELTTQCFSAAQRHAALNREVGALFEDIKPISLVGLVDEKEFSQTKRAPAQLRLHLAVIMGHAMLSYGVVPRQNLAKTVARLCRIDPDAIAGILSQIIAPESDDESDSDSDSSESAGLNSQVRATLASFMDTTVNTISNPAPMSLSSTRDIWTRFAPAYHTVARYEPMELGSVKRMSFDELMEHSEENLPDLVVLDSIIPYLINPKILRILNSNPESFFLTYGSDQIWCQISAAVHALAAAQKPTSPSICIVPSTQPSASPIPKNDPINSLLPALASDSAITAGLAAVNLAARPLRPTLVTPLITVLWPAARDSTPIVIPTLTRLEVMPDSKGSTGYLWTAAAVPGAPQTLEPSLWSRQPGSDVSQFKVTQTTVRRLAVTAICGPASGFVSCDGFGMTVDGMLANGGMPQALFGVYAVLQHEPQRPVTVSVDGLVFTDISMVRVQVSASEIVRQPLAVMGSLG
ncbi:hypothetical protein J8273_5310 [Carpediemonas membranifera]|uniref:Uncharacterized protein n=1 Tax=Carpediemonas membranifera TaxID=201153 RepID=A0A8J6E0V6_9EUKA|nr:hypothetical protein J8273_5310 [Carpediemonas membranifera]|eukprot:KAG9392321.1 hypothetical protein J8273_5310 [Carpediemonas membranifera]